MGVVFPEGNNPLTVNNSDVYNPLKAITVLLYRTTDQDQNFDILWKFWIFLKFLKFWKKFKFKIFFFFIDFIILKFYEIFERVVFLLRHAMGCLQGNNRVVTR